ncbi:unnamed protein product [Dovyalis caffra]|uniref:Uncharacterized protein n=1 Tax=Dovyalis caffra TaxID=77055 RepID=A0AAV1STA8_9ROSI|nr:unnamed protein product [Dovyalis caffra]
MDATVDAMKSYGFSNGLIVSTVRGLLVEGWPFTEGSSDKVLLEAILEEVEKEEHEKCYGMRLVSSILPDGSLYDYNTIEVPNSLKKQIIDGKKMTMVHFDGVQQLGNTSHPTQPPYRVPPRRHRPYYGWISSHDDEENLMELKPAPLPTGLAKLFSGTDVEDMKENMGCKA